MTIIHTSPPSTFYNCIAWAAGDTDNWWWPNSYWPREVPRELTLDAFILTYMTIGYYPCDGGHLELGFEKVAIYADQDEPRHAARQLSNGQWTSKLGQNVDVEHDLNELRNHVLQASNNQTDYGLVVTILRRPDFSRINMHIPF